MARRRVVRNLRSEVDFSPLASVNNILSIVSTLVGLVVALLGISEVTGSSRSSGGVSLSEMALPFRVIVIAIVAAGIGWMVGLVSVLLSRFAPDIRTFGAKIIAGLLAAVLTGCIFWLTENQVGLLPEQDVMLVIGLGLAMCMCRLQLSSSAGGPEEMKDRARTLLTFMTVAGVFTLLALLGDA